MGLYKAHRASEDYGGDGMSREIKFRAWDKKYNIMIEPEAFKRNDIWICGDGRVFELEEWSGYGGGGMREHDCTEQYILMQFTGVRDKNGKGREMYESDVYKQDSRHYVIEWSEYHCGWVVRSLASGAVLPGHLKNEVAVYDDYEYIGSIQEHPHLLEARSAIGTTE